MLLTSLQSRLPVPQEFIKSCCDFLFLLLLLHFLPPLPSQKPPGKQSSHFFFSTFYNCSTSSNIFFCVCVSLCMLPVSSLIFIVCWEGMGFSIYWHIYLMCFAAQGVIKQCLSPFKQRKLHLTTNFPCHPSTSFLTWLVHKTICSCTDA